MFGIKVHVKSIFYLISILSLIVVASLSYNAPLSGDEEVHFIQAKKNLAYFKTLGEDKTALDTPISRLKHYGQSFDNVTTLFIEWFDIENIYRFRHISNAVVAWLLMVFTGLLTFNLTRSYPAATLSIVLLLISPRFVGHAMNNLKDIPFAFGYIMALYYTLRAIQDIPKIRWSNFVLLGIGISIGIGIRIGGLLLFCYLWLFFSLAIYQYFLIHPISERRKFQIVWNFTFTLLVLSLLSYFGGLILWPFAWENPIAHPFESLQLMHNYPTTVRQIFEGKLYWSEQFPWYYALKYMIISIPLVVLAGFVFFIMYAWRMGKRSNPLWFIFVLIAVGFPIYYSALTGANLYGGWRQLLFIYPPLVVLSSAGLFQFYLSFKKRSTKVIYLVAMIFLLILPISHMIRNHPYHYVYFNELSGGYGSASGQYEGDYYFTSYQEAYDWLYLKLKSDHVNKPVVIANNFPIDWYVKSTNLTVSAISIDYFRRGEYDWDYAVFCNTYLPPYQLDNGIWPPENTIHQIFVDGKPVCAILKREIRDDFRGRMALDTGAYDLAIRSYRRALDTDPSNESALLNLSIALWKSGDRAKADETLDILFNLYPDYEWANELKGEMLIEDGNLQEALSVFESNLKYNYKFFHSYLSISRVYQGMEDHDRAIESLKKCLRLNPFYKPAYLEAGELYKKLGKIEESNKFFRRANAL